MVDCPYGASTCPKIDALEDMVEKNGEELKRLSFEVTKLSTTVRNVSFLTTFIISILVTLIEVFK